MTNFAERVGTNDDDLLLGASFTISFGLDGNDTLTSAFAAPYQVLAGGLGDDLYDIGRGDVATVYDADGRDILEINGVSFSGQDSYILTLDDRHLVAGDISTGTEVYLINYRSSSIDTVILDDTVIGYETLLEVFQDRPNYFGNYSYEGLRAEGFDLPSTSEAREDVAFYIDREAQLQEAADFEFTREDALAVARLYGGAFGRQPDVEGVNFWIDLAENGFSRYESAFYFLDSDEFTNNYGNDDLMSNERFIDVMYDNVLGRDQDPTGFDFWVQQMDNGLSREDTLIYFADSDENIANSGYLNSFQESDDGNWVFVI